MKNLTTGDVCRLIGGLVGTLVSGGVPKSEIRAALKAWGEDWFIDTALRELERIEPKGGRPK